MMADQLLAQSAIDRLLHHASVVVTDGGSYPMRQARAKGGALLAADTRKGRDPVRSRPLDRPRLRQDYLPRMFPSCLF